MRGEVADSLSLGDHVDAARQGRRASGFAGTVLVVSDGDISMNGPPPGEGELHMIGKRWRNWSGGQTATPTQSPNQPPRQSWWRW